MPLPGFIETLCKEIVLKGEYLDNEEIKSIYFGGGTPSLLNFRQINKVLAVIKNNHHLSPDCEITLEANPDDISGSYATQLIEQTPVNRLSIGIQSFYDNDLRFLNRRHDAAQSFSCIEQARKAGFNNINIDLMYGIPGMTLEKWKDNLHFAFNGEVQHVSAYNLTVEPQTPLYHMINEGKAETVDEEQSREQYKLLCKIASASGFCHYEISNFCKDSFYSYHNSCYWKQIKYMGLGPSAHSFDKRSRQWNLPDVSSYMHAIQNDKEFFNYEIINELMRYNEYIMVSLRTIWGADLELIRSRFGTSAAERFGHASAEFLATGHMTQNNSIYTITEASWFISDYIIGKLFQQ